MSWRPGVQLYITPARWKVKPLKSSSLRTTTRKFTRLMDGTRHFSHCATEGTAFPCDGGGSGGGQFGALTPGFFRGGFLRLAGWARGAGVGRALASAAAGAVVGCGGAWGLGGAGGLGLEKWTVNCSLAWLDGVLLKDLFAVRWEKENRGIKGNPRKGLWWKTVTYNTCHLWNQGCRYYLEESVLNHCIMRCF